MRINPSVNNISFSAENKNKPVSNKSKQADYCAKSNLEKTRDYLVKTPQKYLKIDTVLLPDNLNAHIYKLESGQKIVIIPKDGPTVIKSYVNTGSLNEKDSERGISHFVEHSLFNGSEGLSEGEFFSTVNEMGANTNASTGFSATDYYIKSNLLKDTDLNEQIRIHASMIETPKFTPEMIEKEKGPVTSEISMILDDAENVAINTTIKNLFNIKSTSTDIIGGTIDNINNLTREKVLDYYKKNYYPANIVTVITGDVNEKEVISLVSKHMQSRTKPIQKRDFETLIPIDKTIRQDITSQKASTGFVSIGLKGPQNNNIKDQIMSDAVNYILTGSTLSRINKGLENLQTEADINIERLSSKLSDNTALLISLEVDNKKIDKAINKINSALKSISDTPPTQDEIEIIKKNLKFDFANRFENSSDINSLAGFSMLNGDLSYITEYEETIDNLSPQDFVDYGKKYLDTNKEAITVIHPSNKISFSGRKPLNLEDTQTKTLSNNILLVEKNTNKNVVYIDLRLSNTLDETNLGASAILSKILEHGTSKRTKDEFYLDAEKNGILLGFSAGNESIKSSSTFMKQDATKALRDIKDVILNPRFLNEDFEEVKKQLLQDLKDTPVTAKDGLYKYLFKNQPKGVTKNELLKEIEKTTLNDVVELHKKLIDNSQLQIVVSGPFNDVNFKNTVETELENDFLQFKKSELNEKKSYTPVLKTEVVTDIHNKSQAEIISGYKFKINDNSPENMIKYTLVNIILGGTASSRLFNDLREKQKLAYHVKSYLDYNDKDTGVCNLYIKTTTDSNETYKNIEKSIIGFNSHIKEIQKNGVSKEELENAKLVFKNRLYNDNETTSDKNSALLSNLQSKNGLSLTNDVMDLIDKISLDDIKDAIDEMFCNPAVYSVVAKKEALENNQQFLKNLTS